MKKCYVCGKELKIWEGYHHPSLEKKELVCNKCLDVLEKSIEFYKKCLFEGRQNHKKECYFWDSKKNKCRNEKFFAMLLLN